MVILLILIEIKLEQSNLFIILESEWVNKQVMSLFRISFSLVLFLGLLVGCQSKPDLSIGSGSAVPDASTVPPTPSSEEGYPVLANVENTYPGWSTGDSAVIITRTPNPTVDPSIPIPTPIPGMTTLIGYIFSKETNQPLVDVPVSLAEIYRNAENQGAFAYDTAFSPMTLTDSNGRFILSNIEPKEYVMVVGNVEVNRYEILLEPSGDGLIFTLQPNMITDAGTLYVGFEW